MRKTPFFIKAIALTLCFTFTVTNSIAYSDGPTISGAIRDIASSISNTRLPAAAPKFLKYLRENYFFQTTAAVNGSRSELRNWQDDLEGDLPDDSYRESHVSKDDYDSYTISDFKKVLEALKRGEKLDISQQMDIRRFNDYVEFGKQAWNRDEVRALRQGILDVLKTSDQIAILSEIFDVALAMKIEPVYWSDILKARKSVSFRQFSISKIKNRLPDVASELKINGGEYIFYLVGSGILFLAAWKSLDLLRYFEFVDDLATRMLDFVKQLRFTLLICGMMVAAGISVYFVMKIYDDCVKNYREWQSTLDSMINQPFQAFIDEHIFSAASRRKATKLILEVKEGGDFGMPQLRVAFEVDPTVRESEFYADANPGEEFFTVSADEVRKIFKVIKQEAEQGKINKTRERLYLEARQPKTSAANAVYLGDLESPDRKPPHYSFFLFSVPAQKPVEDIAESLVLVHPSFHSELRGNSGIGNYIVADSSFKERAPIGDVSFTELIGEERTALLRKELQEFGLDQNSISHVLQNAFPSSSNAREAISFEYEEAARQLKLIKNDLRARLHRLRQAEDHGREIVVYALGLGKAPAEAKEIITLFLNTMEEELGEESKDWSFNFIGIDFEDEPIKAAREYFSEELTSLKKKGFHKVTLQAVKASALSSSELGRVFQEAGGSKKADYLFHRHVLYANRASSWLNRIRSLGLNAMILRILLASALESYLQSQNLVRAFAKAGTRYIIEPLDSTDPGVQDVVIPGARALPQENGTKGSGIYTINDPAIFISTGFIQYLRGQFEENRSELRGGKLKFKPYHNLIGHAFRSGREFFRFSRWKHSLLRLPGSFGNLPDDILFPIALLPILAVVWAADLIDNFEDSPKTTTKIWFWIVIGSAAWFFSVFTANFVLFKLQKPAKRKLPTQSSHKMKRSELRQKSELDLARELVANAIQTGQLELDLFDRGKEPAKQILREVLAEDQKRQSDHIQGIETARHRMATFESRFEKIRDEIDFDPFKPLTPAEQEKIMGWWVDDLYMMEYEARNYLAEIQSGQHPFSENELDQVVDTLIAAYRWSMDVLAFFEKQKAELLFFRNQETADNEELADTMAALSSAFSVLVDIKSPRGQIPENVFFAIAATKRPKAKEFLLSVLHEVGFDKTRSETQKTVRGRALSYLFANFNGPELAALAQQAIENLSGEQRFDYDKWAFENALNELLSYISSKDVQAYVFDYLKYPLQFGKALRVGNFLEYLVFKLETAEIPDWFKERLKVYSDENSAAMGDFGITENPEPYLNRIKKLNDFLTLKEAGIEFPSFRFSHYIFRPIRSDAEKYKLIEMNGSSHGQSSDWSPWDMTDFVLEDSRTRQIVGGSSFTHNWQEPSINFVALSDQLQGQERKDAFVFTLAGTLQAMAPKIKDRKVVWRTWVKNILKKTLALDLAGVDLEPLINQSPDGARSELRSKPESQNPILEINQDWKNVFDDNAEPLVVDAGFGNGETLLYRAQHEPDKNFIGIELPEEPYADMLVERIQAAGIKNLKVLKAADYEAFRAQLELGNKEIISELTYYDPFPDSPYAFREHTDDLRQILKPGALIKIMVFEPEFRQELVNIFTPNGFQELDPTEYVFEDNHDVFDINPDTFSTQYKLIFQWPGSLPGRSELRHFGDQRILRRAFQGIAFGGYGTGLIAATWQMLTIYPEMLRPSLFAILLTWNLYQIAKLIFKQPFVSQEKINQEKYINRQLVIAHLPQLGLIKARILAPWFEASMQAPEVWALFLTACGVLAAKLVFDSRLRNHGRISARSELRSNDPEEPNAENPRMSTYETTISIRPQINPTESDAEQANLFMVPLENVNPDAVRWLDRVFKSRLPEGQYIFVSVFVRDENSGLQSFQDGLYLIAKFAEVGGPFEEIKSGEIKDEKLRHRIETVGKGSAVRVIEFASVGGGDEYKISLRRLQGIVEKYYSNEPIVWIPISPEGEFKSTLGWHHKSRAYHLTLMHRAPKRRPDARSELRSPQTESAVAKLRFSQSVDLISLPDRQLVLDTKTLKSFSQISVLASAQSGGRQEKIVIEIPDGGKRLDVALHINGHGNGEGGQFSETIQPSQSEWRGNSGVQAQLVALQWTGEQLVFMQNLAAAGSLISAQIRDESSKSFEDRTKVHVPDFTKYDYADIQLSERVAASFRLNGYRKTLELLKKSRIGFRKYAQLIRIYQSWRPKDKTDYFGISYDDAVYYTQHPEARLDPYIIKSPVTAKNLALAALDTIPGFKEIRLSDPAQRPLRAEELVKLFEREVFQYRSKDPTPSTGRRRKDGPSGFFRENGRLGVFLRSDHKLFGKSKLSAILKLAVPEIVKEFRPTDFQNKYWTDDIRRERILRVLDSIPGFRKLRLAADRDIPDRVPQMAELYRRHAMTFRSARGRYTGQVGFFRIKGEIFRGKAIDLLQLAVPELVDPKVSGALSESELKIGKQQKRKASQKPGKRSELRSDDGDNGIILETGKQVKAAEGYQMKLQSDGVVAFYRERSGIPDPEPFTTVKPTMAGMPVYDATESIMGYAAITHRFKGQGEGRKLVAKVAFYPVSGFDIKKIHTSYVNPLAFNISVREVREKFFDKLKAARKTAHVYIVHDTDGDGLPSAVILQGLVSLLIPKQNIHLVGDNIADLEGAISASGSADHNFVILTDLQGALSDYQRRVSSETKQKVSEILSIDHHLNNDPSAPGILVHPTDKWGVEIEEEFFPSAAASLFLAVDLIARETSLGHGKAVDFFGKYFLMAVLALHHDIFQLKSRPFFGPWHKFINQFGSDFEYPIREYEELLNQLLLLDRLSGSNQSAGHWIRMWINSFSEELLDAIGASTAHDIYARAFSRLSQMVEPHISDLKKINDLINQEITAQKSNLKPGNDIIFSVIPKKRIESLGLTSGIEPRVRTVLAGRMALHFSRTKKGLQPSAIVVFEQDTKDINRWHVRFRAIRSRKHVSNLANRVNLGSGRSANKRSGLLALGETLNPLTGNPYSSVEEAITAIVSAEFFEALTEEQSSDRKYTAMLQWIEHDQAGFMRWLKGEISGVLATIDMPSGQFMKLPDSERRKANQHIQETVFMLYAVDDFLFSEGAEAIIRNIDEARRALDEIYRASEWHPEAFLSIQGSKTDSKLPSSSEQAWFTRDIFNEYLPKNKVLYEALLGHWGSGKLNEIVDKLLPIFERVPKHLFMPKYLRQEAYLHDAPYRIGYGQTISQPSLVAFILVLLDLEPSDEILEVGAGSGWLAALMSQQAAQVYATELIPQLAGRSERVIENMGIQNVSIIQADGSIGYPQAAPFDKIVVSAGSPEVPQTLADQLREGGKLVIPVFDEVQSDEQVKYYKLKLFVKENGVLIEKLSVNNMRFVDLRGTHGWQAESKRSELHREDQNQDLQNGRPTPQSENDSDRRIIRATDYLLAKNVSFNQKDIAKRAEVSGQTVTNRKHANPSLARFVDWALAKAPKAEPESVQALIQAAKQLQKEKRPAITNPEIARRAGYYPQIISKLGAQYPEIKKAAQQAIESSPELLSPSIKKVVRIIKIAAKRNKTFGSENEIAQKAKIRPETLSRIKKRPSQYRKPFVRLLHYATTDPARALQIIEKHFSTRSELRVSVQTFAQNKSLRSELRTDGAIQDPGAFVTAVIAIAAFGILVFGFDSVREHVFKIGSAALKLIRRFFWLWSGVLWISTHLAYAAYRARLDLEEKIYQAAGFNPGDLYYSEFLYPRAIFAVFVYPVAAFGLMRYLNNWVMRRNVLPFETLPSRSAPTHHKTSGLDTSRKVGATQPSDEYLKDPLRKDRAELRASGSNPKKKGTSKAADEMARRIKQLTEEVDRDLEAADQLRGQLDQIQKLLPELPKDITDGRSELRSSRADLSTASALPGHLAKSELRNFLPNQNPINRLDARQGSGIGERGGVLEGRSGSNSEFYNYRGEKVLVVPTNTAREIEALGDFLVLTPSPKPGTQDHILFYNSSGGLLFEAVNVVNYSLAGENLAVQFANGNIQFYDKTGKKLFSSFDFIGVQPSQINLEGNLLVVKKSSHEVDFYNSTGALILRASKGTDFDHFYVRGSFIVLVKKNNHHVYSGLTGKLVAKTQASMGEIVEFSGDFFALVNWNQFTFYNLQGKKILEKQTGAGGETFKVWSGGGGLLSFHKARSLTIYDESGNLLTNIQKRAFDSRIVNKVLRLEDINADIYEWYDFGPNGKSAASKQGKTLAQILNNNHALFQRIQNYVKSRYGNPVVLREGPDKDFSSALNDMSNLMQARGLRTEWIDDLSKKVSKGYNPSSKDAQLILEEAAIQLGLIQAPSSQTKEAAPIVYDKKAFQRILGDKIILGAIQNRKIPLPTESERSIVKFLADDGKDVRIADKPDEPGVNLRLEFYLWSDNKTVQISLNSRAQDLKWHPSGWEVAYEEVKQLKDLQSLVLPTAAQSVSKPVAGARKQLTLDEFKARFEQLQNWTNHKSAFPGPYLFSYKHGSTKLSVKVNPKKSFPSLEWNMTTAGRDIFELKIINDISSFRHGWHTYISFHSGAVASFQLKGNHLIDIDQGGLKTKFYITVEFADALQLQQIPLKAKNADGIEWEFIPLSPNQILPAKSELRAQTWQDSIEALDAALSVEPGSRQALNQSIEAIRQMNAEDDPFDQEKIAAALQTLIASGEVIRSELRRPGGTPDQVSAIALLPEATHNFATVTPQFVKAIVSRAELRQPIIFYAKTLTEARAVEKLLAGIPEARGLVEFVTSNDELIARAELRNITSLHLISFNEMDTSYTRNLIEILIKNGISVVKNNVSDLSDFLSLFGQKMGQVLIEWKAALYSAMSA